ncbi:uncharacterized protein METZ01_LOCUS127058 [marine metagenome]|uniref:PDZ domain-containing protein n=1 Tax=marine metagenome TaxID=408172 RepID=A0A381YB26_9ZZZZ
MNKKLIVFISSLSLLLNNCAGPISTITQMELKSHVRYLASDRLQGRFPGTNGDRKAAEYIRNQFKNSSLTLLGDAGFQYFDIITDVSLGHNNSLTIDQINFSVGIDFVPLSFSQNITLTAPIIFVGFGFDFQNDSLSWNDYSDIDVARKWVLILRGSPDGNNPHGGFSEHSSLRKKVMIAKDHSVAGVIFTSGSKFDESDALIPLRYDQSQINVSIPVIHVKREVADLLLYKSGGSLVSLENTVIQMKEKFKSIELKKNVSVSTTVKHKTVQTQNIVGVLPGIDEQLKNEYVVMGAHYDHLGFGGEHSGSRRPDHYEIHNGADDNASGVSIMMELAELFSHNNSNKRTLVFVGFGAEEMGLLGSKHFVKSGIVENDNIQIMLNMDMVGRLDRKENKISIGGTHTAVSLESEIENIVSKTSLKYSFSPEGYGPSDHSSFYVNDTPVLFFFTGAHNDYHTPDDDAEKINYKGMKVLSQLIYSIADYFSNMDERLVFQEAGPKKQEERQRFKVTLGIMPDYTYSATRGLRIDAVLNNKPASIAGLEDGDIIIKMNGNSVDDIYEYMHRLSEFNPGDEVKVKVVRGKEEKTVIVKF